MELNLKTRIVALILIVSMLVSFMPAMVEAKMFLPQEATTQQVSYNEEVKLSGVIKDGGILDGAKHGYPLYAKMTLTNSTGSQIFYSDPFTGEYEIMIEPSVEYTIIVEAQLPGYQIIQETFSATASLTKNYDLNVQSTCVAPGYMPDYNYFYNFEESEQGFTFGGQNSSWAWGGIYKWARSSC